jgi:DNA mismatch repair protein MutS
VARLAGIPKAVITRAEAVLKELESEGAEMRETLVAARERKKPGLKQKELFAPPPDPIVEALRALDIDGLSPREALALLAKWKEQAGG